MAKITGPLLSRDASGLIGERLVFSKRTTGNQARFQRSQKDYTNAARSAQRALYTSAYEAWNLLNDNDKEYYRVLSIALNITGYNLFVQLFLKGEILDSTYSYFGTREYGIFYYGKSL